MMKRFLVLIIILFVTVTVQAQTIKWVSLSKAQEQAAENNKKVMLFAEASWCGYCKKMHDKVFPEKSVQDSLGKYFYPVRLDIESSETVVFNGTKFTKRGLARKFRVNSTPTTIFLDSEGEVIGGQPGFLPADVFDKMLSFVGSDLTGKQSFSKYLEEHGVDMRQ